MGKQAWIDEIPIEIERLLNEKPSKESALLLNALFGIMERIAETPKAALMGFNNIVEMIADELSDAEKFLLMYRETEDRDYIQIAFDESTHANKFIKMAKAQNIDVENYERWLLDLNERIGRL